jgi:hypothetical protein
MHEGKRNVGVLNNTQGLKIFSEGFSPVSPVNIDTKGEFIKIEGMNRLGNLVLN